jgi:hypothetical protein
VNGALHDEDALLPFSHVTLQEAGVKEYEPGPSNAGVSVPPLQDHSAAYAVPMGFSAAKARSMSVRFGACGPRSATPVPLLLFNAPLTVLTATSEPEGAVVPSGPEPAEPEGPAPVVSIGALGGALEQANAPRARATHERDASVGADLRIMMFFSFGEVAGDTHP